MVCACEDVGLAWPQIIPIVKAAVDIANAVGLPEARLPLADAVVLVATAPKSNSAHDASMPPLRTFRPGAPAPSRASCKTSITTAPTPRSRGSTTSTRMTTPTTGPPSNTCPTPSRTGSTMSPGDNKKRAGFRTILEKNQRRTVIMPNLHCEAIAFPSSDGSTPPPHSSTLYPVSLCGLSFSSATACANMCAAMNRWPSSTLPTALRWRATTTSPR